MPIRFTRADIPAVAIAATTAAVAGIGFGVWAAPPSYLSEPLYRGPLLEITADDPNLARYKRVIAEQGVTAAPRYVVAWIPPATTPEADAGAALEAQLAEEAAAFAERETAREARRLALVESRTETLSRPRPYAVAYDEPAREPEPERWERPAYVRPTYARPEYSRPDYSRDEPAPPPVPTYSGPRYAQPAVPEPVYQADPRWGR